MDKHVRRLEDRDLEIGVATTPVVYHGSDVQVLKLGIEPPQPSTANGQQSFDTTRQVPAGSVLA